MDHWKDHYSTIHTRNALMSTFPEAERSSANMGDFETDRASWLAMLDPKYRSGVNLFLQGKFDRVEGIHDLFFEKYAERLLDDRILHLIGGCCPRLRSLCVEKSPITTADLRRYQQLEEFFVGSFARDVVSPLQQVNGRGCRSLETMGLSDCHQLTKVDVTGCVRLATLELEDGRSLSTINLSGCVNLSHLTRQSRNQIV